MNIPEMRMLTKKHPYEKILHDACHIVAYALQIHRKNSQSQPLYVDGLFHKKNKELPVASSPPRVLF